MIIVTVLIVVCLVLGLVFEHGLREQRPRHASWTAYLVDRFSKLDIRSDEQLEREIRQLEDAAEREWLNGAP